MTQDLDNAGAAPRRPLSRSAGSYGYPFWLDELMTDMPRFDEALCAVIDPALWFPEKGEPSKVARSLCGSCQERIACLEYAMGYEGILYGVWGGLTLKQRQRLHREARDAA